MNRRLTMPPVKAPLIWTRTPLPQGQRRRRSGAGPRNRAVRAEFHDTARALRQPHVAWVGSREQVTKGRRSEFRQSPARHGCRGGARGGRRARAPSAPAAPRRCLPGTGGSARRPGAAPDRAARTPGQSGRRSSGSGAGAAGLGFCAARAGRAQGRGACGASGPSAARTSAADSTRVAPSRSSWLVPRWRGSSGLPGTAMTSRPCSAARRAVISEPDCGAASTTTTPRLRPEISRLRRGKWRACGTAPSGRSETMAPHAAIRSMSPAFSLG
jgi:hypothetical protein